MAHLLRDALHLRGAQARVGKTVSLLPENGARVKTSTWRKTRITSCLPALLIHQTQGRPRRKSA
jgi:hypothetical protein